MKITLNEEQLTNIVMESVMETLKEGFFSDRIQDRKMTKINQENKMKQLRSLLNQAGVSDLKEKNLYGDAGFTFTCPMDEAVSVAKQLKRFGVSLKTLKQSGQNNVGEIWNATVFAYFGPSSFGNLTVNN